MLCQNGLVVSIFGNKKGATGFSKNGKCHFHTLNKLQVVDKLERSYERILINWSKKPNQGKRVFFEKTKKFTFMVIKLQPCADNYKNPMKGFGYPERTDERTNASEFIGLKPPLTGDQQFEYTCVFYKKLGFLGSRPRFWSKTKKLEASI